MNTRHSSGWFGPALAVVCLTLPFFANKAATNRAASQPQGRTVPANVKTAGGLTVVTFTANPGTIKVNLPDDMMAGDTISGTVVTEPKGNTKEERAANQSELKKLGIRLIGRPEEKPEEVSCGDVAVAFKFVLAQDDTRRSLAFAVALYVKLGDTLDQIVITPDPKITPPTKWRDLPGEGLKVITPDPKITPSFIIPPLGQTGRTIVITGPFDGNSSNTTLNGSAQRTNVQDFEKNTENVSGGFGLLAESPRKAVFQSPTNVTGPIPVTLKEGNAQTTGNHRNVDVNLSAPKTSLLKGERTELRVEVSGLEGIKQPVPLTLECTGVITMEGGAYQPLTIQPSEVGADGRYSTTRGITGVQPGGWGATATVVTGRFDVCLQDDTAPHRRILWNTFTGEYIFINPFPPPRPSDQPPQTGSTTPTGLTGTGKPVRKGCILTLTHNAPDRRVMSRLDGCNKTGDASVETTSPKLRSTLNDYNIADSGPCPN